MLSVHHTSRSRPPDGAVTAPAARRPAGLPGYAELHCASNFSFLTGASHPEERVARAHALRYGALAITDECSFSGVVRAHAQAKAPLIESARRGHRVLQSNHPSPLSALRPPVPFIGCGHFTQVRDFLAARGGLAIDWSA